MRRFRIIDSKRGLVLREANAEEIRVWWSQKRLYHPNLPCFNEAVRINDSELVEDYQQRDTHEVFQEK